MPTKPNKSDHGHVKGSSSAPSQTRIDSPEKKMGSGLGDVQEKIAPISVEELFNLEDAAAAARDLKQDLALQSKLSTSIRNLMSEYQKAKSKEDNESLFNIQTQVLCALAECRRISRLTHFQNKKIRDQTAQERQKLDEKYLQLQNLLYEVMHLKKEVKRCLEFKSGHEEIELVPVDVFYKDAPQSIANKALTENNPHQLRLARLQWELEERKGLAVMLEELEREDASIALDIEKKICVLDSLLPMVNDIAQSVKPAQKLFGVDHDKKIAQRERQSFLPEPLFALCVRASTFRDIADKHLEVSIEGDFDAAKERFASASPGIDDKECDDESDVELDSEGPKQPSTVANDVANNDSSARERSRRKTVTDTPDDSRQNLTACGPLYLVLKFPCKGKGTITLIFNYLPVLEIVTVKCQLELSQSFPRAVASARDLLSADSILLNLFPNDSGNACLSPSGNHKLEQSKLEFQSLVGNVGACYKWAQDLAGLNGAETSSSNSGIKRQKTASLSGDDYNRLQAVVKRIKQRVIARLALHDQLASLEALNFFTFTSDCVKLFPAKLVSKLTSWKFITFDDFKVHPTTQAAIDSGLVNESGWHFQLSLENGETRLLALVFVHNDYPCTPPVFCIALNCAAGAMTIRNNERIKYMERVLNVNFKVPAKSENYTLCCQVAQLAAMLDVLLQVDSERLGLSSRDNSQERLLSRMKRCIDHQIPTFWSVERKRYCFRSD